jgi:hypothetical protein
LIGVTLVMWLKNGKCKCSKKKSGTKKKKNIDDDDNEHPLSDSEGEDSDELEDDICIEDTKPKNPFQFKT